MNADAGVATGSTSAAAIAVAARILEQLTNSFSSLFLSGSSARACSGVPRTAPGPGRRFAKDQVLSLTQ